MHEWVVLCFHVLLCTRLPNVSIVCAIVWLVGRKNVGFKN